MPGSPFSPPASAITVDLSALPAPLAVEVDFEKHLAERVADLRSRDPAFDALVESDPAMKLLQVDAYRELLTRAAINDATKSVMIAFAAGANLDHLAAFYGVSRLELAPATALDPAVMESDADLRVRVQLAPEGFAGPGMTGGGYRGRALAASAEVKDAAIVKRPLGHVDVVLLGRSGNGALGADVVDQVFRAFQDDEGAQLTDIVAVRAANVVPYQVRLTLKVRFGPDPDVVRAAAEASLRAYASSRHRVGQIVYAQMLEAAASVGGVEQARVDIPDVDPGDYGAAWLEALETVIEAAQ